MCVCVCVCEREREREMLACMKLILPLGSQGHDITFVPCV